MYVTALYPYSNMNRRGQMMPVASYRISMLVIIKHPLCLVFIVKQIIDTFTVASYVLNKFLPYGETIKNPDLK